MKATNYPWNTKENGDDDEMHIIKKIKTLFFLLNANTIATMNILVTLSTIWVSIKGVM